MTTFDTRLSKGAEKYGMTARMFGCNISLLFSFGRFRTTSYKGGTSIPPEQAMRPNMDSRLRGNDEE
jgi:hypothetical protein